MSTEAEIDAALDAVVLAARNHRSVLRAGAGEERVWRAYVALNNATVRYDDLISDVYDEVTPWDCEFLEGDTDVPAGDQPAAGSWSALTADADTAAEDWTEAQRAQRAAAYEDIRPGAPSMLVSVRHRRDYVIPDPSRLVAVATEARATSWATVDAQHAGRPVTGVGEAVNELVQSGDGTVGALDAYPDELIPGNGVLLVNAVRHPLTFNDPTGDRGTSGAPGTDEPFRLAAEEVQLYRMDEEVVDEEPADDTEYEFDAAGVPDRPPALR